MNERDIKEKAEQIIDALMELSVGREPNLLSTDAFKKLSKHPNFDIIKNEYINYLQSFKGSIETTDEIKKLFDFRIKIVELMNL